MANESGICPLKGAEQVPAGLSPNSALYWLPNLGIVSALSEMVPRTMTVPYDHNALVEAMEGGKYEGLPDVITKVYLAADSIGYPVFIRTDLSSAKHCGPESYLARSERDVKRVLCRTAEDNEMKFWMSPETPRAFLVRQFLELDAPFVAFGGLPVAREWRFFVNPSEVICAHPYWPEEAIAEGYFDGDGPEGWRVQLAALHERPSDDEWHVLTNAALMAAAANDRSGAWSVDFAKDKSGKWWLIDMAVAAQSWHWPTCERAAEIKGGAQ